MISNFKKLLKLPSLELEQCGSQFFDNLDDFQVEGNYILYCLVKQSLVIVTDIPTFLKEDIFAFLHHLIFM